MIALEQWRARIGSFTQKRRKTKLLGTTLWFSELCDSFFSCGDMKVLASIALMLLVISGLETNPGPNMTIDELAEIMNRQFKNLNEDNAKLRQEVASLKDLKNEIDRNKRETKEQSEVIRGLATRHDVRLNSLEARVEELEQETEKQQIYSRRENILLKNVKEESGENVMEKVINLLNQSVRSKPWNWNDFQRVHRLGKEGVGHCRAIIVRFVNFQDKLRVLRARQELEKVHVRVTNDLTWKQRETLSNLNDEGIDAYYKGNKLIRSDRSIGQPAVQVGSNTPSGHRPVTQGGVSTPASGQQTGRGRGLANGRVHGDRRGRGRGRGGAWRGRPDRRLDTRDYYSVGSRTADDNWLDSWLAGGGAGAMAGAGAGGEAMEHDGAAGGGRSDPCDHDSANQDRRGEATTNGGKR